ncbi:MAG: hypothetical protein QM737_08080 [Ferruginibacter sp.]
MENSILSKKYNWFIYLLIILCFVILGFWVWLYFEWKVEPPKNKTPDAAVVTASNKR